VIAERRRGKLFVLRVQAAPGSILAFAVQQVAKIVQQRGGDQSAFAASAMNEPCGLQRVLEHGDRLAEIGFASSAFEKLENIIH
jgi:hypothetical protein